MPLPVTNSVGCLSLAPVSSRGLPDYADSYRDRGCLVTVVRLRNLAVDTRVDMQSAARRTATPARDRQLIELLRKPCTLAGRGASAPWPGHIAILNFSSVL